MINVCKEEKNASLKEIQENTFKKIEVFKRETNKLFKEIQDNTSKVSKEINNTVKVLKTEIVEQKKTKSPGILVIKKLRK